MQLRFVITLALATSGCAASPKSAPPSPLLGQTLPLELKDLGGRSFTLQQLHGEVVLLDVWATWCGPCAESFPFYAELHRELGAQGFSVVAVSVDADDADVAGFLKNRDIPFTVLRDPQGSLPNHTKLEVMPTAYVIDREGRVAHVHEGFRDRDKVALKQHINDLLDRPGAARTSSTASP